MYSRKGNKRRSSKASTKPVKDPGIRLNRYIASTGLCSRREADELISNGLITVNGKVVTQLGTKVLPGDSVKYEGKTLKNEKKVYILMNKPKNFVTTVSDPKAGRNVMDIIGSKCPERVYPVGRLDKNTTGVLLFTNDGDLTSRLIHPKYKKKKIYHIFLNRNLMRSDLVKIANGMELEDGFIKPDAVHYVDENDKSQVGIELHSGKNRIVRRIFESLDYKIKKLDRVYFAGLTKKGLQRGQWRYLTDKEISMLKMNAFD